MRLRIWWSSSSTISRSRNSSGRSRRSTRVTFTPRAAKIEVYSMPITPAPTTASVRGSCRRRTTSSVVRITSPSAFTPGVGAGCVPTAIRMCSAVTWRHPASERMTSVCGSRNDASPWTIVTSFRRSWFSMTSISRVITVSTPAKSWGAGGPVVDAGPGQAIALAGQPGERDHGLAQGLAGDRPGVDAHAPDAAALLDDRRIAPELGGLHGAPADRPGRCRCRRGRSRTGRSSRDGPLAHRLMLSSPGAPARVRRGEQVAIMMPRVTT